MTTLPLVSSVRAFAAARRVAGRVLTTIVSMVAVSACHATRPVTAVVPQHAAVSIQSLAQTGAPRLLPAARTLAVREQQQFTLSREALALAGQPVDAPTLGGPSTGTTLDPITIIWTSSDRTVAIVSAAGQVTAVGTGTAVITATAIHEDGSAEVVGTAVVTVP